eukprot:CAMPEP_0179235476 /NCGR_PEP_ID=MMETSP0797-20121207/13431_1 /TAXON_ID=47934 /ORGANISM="Dinophysis acuminata, Strain DAEP01" /LENGTH=506 /DNA_ID=CAMNT_0020942701 /DNA_START=35 /DNA_END=1555 /DNA_ORIENTATION=+
MADAAGEIARPSPSLLRERCSQVFVDNVFRPSKGAATFGTTDPSSGETLCDSVALAGASDVDDAVDAAHRAFHSSDWRGFDAPRRGRMLQKLADLVERDGAVLASLEAADAGKPVRIARLADVNSAVTVLRAHAGFCFSGSGLSGSELTSSLYSHTGVGLCYTRREPIGVVAAILPFNFPLCGAVAKMAPAVAAGCTIVLKPSERCPHSPLYLCSLLEEAGFPPGVVSAVPGDGATGQALVSHPLVRKISFTGSNAVGRSIQKVAADRLARVTLELGGKNPCIVCPGAGLEDAARIACGGNFFNAGQICVGITRVLVPREGYEEFLQLAKQRVEAKVIGDAFAEGVDLGPVVDERALDRILNFIRLGVEQGARLVTGGKRHGTSGCFIEPTILADVTDDNVVAREEIFGPVMSCQSYDTIDEAVRRANATPFGLVAGVVSKSLEEAVSIAHRLEVGTVWINTHGVYDPVAPYQGRKESGLGQEYGVEGLSAYLETKTVMASIPSGM